MPTTARCGDGDGDGNDDDDGNDGNDDANDGVPRTKYRSISSNSSLVALAHAARSGLSSTGIPTLIVAAIGGHASRVSRHSGSP